MKLPKLFEIYNATENMLESSIRTNTYAHYVTLFAWIGFFLYSIVLRDMWLLLISKTLFISSITFLIIRKIDSVRLELIRK